MSCLKMIAWADQSCKDLQMSYACPSTEMWIELLFRTDLLGIIRLDTLVQCSCTTTGVFGAVLWGLHCEICLYADENEIALHCRGRTPLEELCQATPNCSLCLLHRKELQTPSWRCHTKQTISFGLSTPCKRLRHDFSNLIVGIFKAVIVTISLEKRLGGWCQTLMRVGAWRLHTLAIYKDKKQGVLIGYCPTKYPNANSLQLVHVSHFWIPVQGGYFL